ncbi:hypothetical protein SAMN02745831_07201 [Streptomyces sp. PgraA7]|nr:hypothetical protein SAMN02745831_07201 [Streptomyces sp. PgraA7]
MPFLPVIDTKLNVWTLAAVLTALYTLSGVVRGWWNATLGKRRRLIRAYRRIAPFVRHDYVTEQFGEPAWQHKRTVRKYAAPIEGTELDEPLEDVELTVRTPAPWISLSPVLPPLCTCNPHRHALQLPYDDAK